MRKLIVPVLFLVAVFLFMNGCATQPPQSPEASEAEEVETKKVVEEIQLVSKRLTYYWDGVLASYTNYEYAEEGAVKLQEVYSSDDQMQERIVSKYEGDNLRSRQTFNGEGELLRYHTYTYNSQGLLLEDALYNADDQLQSRQEYEYDEQGKKVRWNVYSSEGALLSYTEYSYENGLNTRIENYSPSGELQDFFTIEYNADRQVTKRTWHEDEDTIEEIRSYSYENGALVEETILRGNGSVKQEIEYSNNEAGNPVEVVYRDGGGTVQEQIAYEYITRTKVSYVPVEE